MYRLLFIILYLLSGDTPHAGRLIVQVNGINTEEGGELYTAVFTRENFPKAGKQFIGKNCVISAKSISIVFENIPAGEYAVASFQDIDKNKKLKTNFIGIPTEPFGFSNDARMVRLPSFERSKFTIKENQSIQISITLR